MEQYKLIEISKKLFNDSFENWDSFLQLISFKDKIVSKWNLKLRDEMEERLIPNSLWTFNKNGMQWYLTEFGPKSFSIWLENSNFSLFADNGEYDTDQISDKLKEERYKAVYEAIVHKDEIRQKSGEGYFIKEKGRFEFESEYDNDFANNYDRLSWFAGNESKKFIDQIERKLQPFMESETTNLMIELNQLCKRKKDI